MTVSEYSRRHSWINGLKIIEEVFLAGEDASQESIKAPAVAQLVGSEFLLPTETAVMDSNLRPKGEYTRGWRF